MRSAGEVGKDLGIVFDFLLLALLIGGARILSDCVIRSDRGEGAGQPHQDVLCLPVCLRRETVWTQAEQELRYSRQQAQALARRSCRAQLLAEFPDAVIEAERCVQSGEADGARCTVTYRFCADIAGTEAPAPQT